MQTLTYDGDEPIRLNKWLAQSGVCSRREADALILDGRVQVDGETVTDAGRKLTRGQTVSFTDAQAVGAKMTVIYNKPVGIVSGQPEPGETPAVRMIRRANVFGPADVYPDRDSKLAPVGRLDKDSHGLLILSEDGVLAKAIIGPDSELEKEYHVTVRGPIFEEKLKWLRHGLELDGRKLKPAIVTQTGPQSLTFILKEGRNRQIRRMCDMCELRVTDLMRVRIGPLPLADLPEGQWRLMTPEERARLIAP
ncbi:MAG TPA: pseudouridine synthase [Asticcacaulis sp.]|nr:pseudouridine synthase [Asticcacaulis sp.]